VSECFVRDLGAI